MTTSTDVLLQQVRARRSLPPAAERRQIRERARVSLRQIAAAMSPPVSHATVRNWEDGGTPRERHRKQYADLLAELRQAVL